MNYDQESIIQHKNHKGKLTVSSKVPLANRDDLSIYYTPGVAQPCREIAEDAEKAYDYTRKGNTVAIISDGSAVLGLGNIGGLAGLPVMEGKAILMKEFADIDAIPIILDTQDPDEIIKTIQNIGSNFGAINLEDIKAPQCFYIEESLKKSLAIPVFHDDQHGTAIVTLAALLNSLKLADKKIEDIKIVISGAGAAGIAIAKLLHTAGASNIVIGDSQGIIYKQREGLNKYKLQVAEYNIDNQQGTIHDALVGADVFVGVSQPNIITSQDIQNMKDKPIVFSMANPNPEITNEEAAKGGAFIYGSGRSDLPNQINNLLAFPGLLRGALDARIQDITIEHKLAAAHALANYVSDPKVEKILPDPLDKGVATAVAEAVKKVGNGN